MHYQCLSDTLLAQFHCKAVAKVSTSKKDNKELEIIIMHFKENKCVLKTVEYIDLLKLPKKAKNVGVVYWSENICVHLVMSGDMEFGMSGDME